MATEDARNLELLAHLVEDSGIQEEELDKARQEYESKLLAAGDDPIARSQTGMAEIKRMIEEARVRSALAATARKDAFSSIESLRRFLSEKLKSLAPEEMPPAFALSFRKLDQLSFDDLKLLAEDIEELESNGNDSES